MTGSTPRLLYLYRYAPTSLCAADRSHCLAIAPCRESQCPVTAINHESIRAYERCHVLTHFIISDGHHVQYKCGMVLTTRPWFSACFLNLDQPKVSASEQGQKYTQNVSNSPGQDLGVLPFSWNFSLPGRPIVNVPIGLVEQLPLNGRSAQTA
jgi:hypothetical protein